MIGDKIVGTCSLCGGPVMTFSVWHGIIPPPKTCQRCGAHAAQEYGSVIPMIPRSTIVKIKANTTSGGIYGL